MHPLQGEDLVGNLEELSDSVQAGSAVATHADVGCAMFEDFMPCQKAKCT